MPEYIDRKALGIGKCNPDIFENKSYANGWNAAIDLLEKAPTADVVEVRHGEWIANRSPIEVEFSCSECGFSYIEADSYQECDYNYCPNCGARMDGDEK